MPDALILYSTNTWLAYQISERYYRGLHYVWCSPYYNSRSLPFYDYSNPPTSTPSEIYKSLYDEVRSGDRHSAKVKANKVGILNGAYAKERAGVINAEQKADIASIIDCAEPRDFRPLLYIIPFNLVREIIKEVPVSDRAHPLSVEYCIECLPRDYFDIIEFDWS
jgi:hypothetical protein